MDDIEYENENGRISDFDEPNEDDLEKNFENVDINLDENIKKKIFEEIEENYKTEKIMSKALAVYKQYKLENCDKGIEVMKSMFNEILEFSVFNFSDRLYDFLEYISCIQDLDLEILLKALDIKNKNLEKENNKDIIFFWKQFIAEQYLEKNKISIGSIEMKDSIKLLLENNFNLNQIYSVFNLFKNVINKKNNQLEMIKSLISIIILYPGYFKKNSAKNNDEEHEDKEQKLNEFVNKIFSKNDEGKKESEYIYDDSQNFVLDFYLKLSGDKDHNNPSELTIQEIFQQLKINNPELSNIKINKINEQLRIIQTIISDIKYKNYDIEDFKTWAKNEVKKLSFDEINSERSTAIILGMISLAIKNDRGYYLRNTQLIAILLFISKEKNTGLIEEISTGEGKSCIISSLSIYFALRNHKVDIISSSYVLAQRDSDEYKNLYSYFNLTTSYPFDSKPEPYTADILYGTFLEFEGDYLREITSNENIRHYRPYDVIIIDEVDNLFIDNILGSTRLTGSSKGYKFLIPFYLTSYISIELFDYIFLLFFKISLEILEDEKIKKKFEDIIKVPEKRKEAVSDILEGDLKDIFHFKDSLPKNEIEINNDIEKEINRIETKKENQEFLKYLDNMKNYLECPKFLHSFVSEEYPNWIDSAFEAKNYIELDRDYVQAINKDGDKDISPVDRTNTGETQLSTVYDQGLHQMLEIKHRLRIKEETLVHTFLSHITFFQKYKDENEFLFFGLTGTIGNEETQKIYKSKYFNSSLIFIPQYKRKRFIELPPLLVNIKDHLRIICKDIVSNFYKGRKVLVICSSIKEAKSIEKELKENFNPENLNIEKKIIQNVDYKESIILYTRSDTEKDNIKIKNKGIILSTNLGGRGTDIKTTISEEEAGGLHVILTYIPNNYRVLKQAFGRTSREGKKGTGQIIINNRGYKSYKEVKQEMLNNEKKRISYIKEQLGILLFKDKLFEDYIELVNSIGVEGYLINDINERWAQFLRVNVSSHEKNLKMEEVQHKFEDFKKRIKNLVKIENDYDKFENPFYKMREGLRKYKYYNKELLNYFNFDDKNKKFYFTQSYIKAVIRVNNTNNYDQNFFNKIFEDLNETITRLNLLIKENINPILNSFEQWDNGLNFIESLLQVDYNYNNLDNIIYIDKPDFNYNFIKTDLYKQYINIKAICNKIIERVEENKLFFENFQNEYKKDKEIEILTTEEDLIEGLNLNEEEIKEQQFFYDATFKYVYKFSLQKKPNYTTSFWYKLATGIIKFLGGLIIGMTAGFLYASGLYKTFNKFVEEKEISTDSLFGNMFHLLLMSTNKKTNSNQQKKIVVAENVVNEIKLEKSTKNNLFEKIMENIEIDFEKIKKCSDLINFLIFVDIYYNEEIWSRRIKQIFTDNFNIVYKTKFIEDNFFKSLVTNKNFNTHLNKYNNLFNEYLEKCIKDILNLGRAKKFNKNVGINCLEHLFIDINSEVITEDMANITIQKMLEYRLILEDGKVNLRLFEECFLSSDGKNILDPTIKFHIINKNMKKNEVKRIKELKEFIVKGFEIPLINSSFIDLADFYQINGYDVQNQLEKDYSLFIINSFKKLIKRSLNIRPIVFVNYYNQNLNHVKALVKDLLLEKLFSKHNKNTMENVIFDELSKEEKIQFDNLIKKARENAINILKK